MIGAAMVRDTVVVHRLLDWHRHHECVSDPELFLLELGVVALDPVLLAVGGWRERRSRRSESAH